MNVGIHVGLGGFLQCWRNAIHRAWLYVLGKTSLTAYKSNTPIFIRNSTATFNDFEGLVKTANIGEARFGGVRRVENLVEGAEQAATQVIAVQIGSEYQARIGANSALGATVTFSGVFTGTLEADGSNSISFANGIPKTASGGGGFSLSCTVSGGIKNFQVEKVTGQSNQNPSEFVLFPWSESYDSTETRVLSLAVYNNKLYAGTSTAGIVFVFDGASWSESYDSTETDIASLAVYNNKLYAGTGKNGIIYVFDGASWVESYDSTETDVSSLAVYNNKLYAGTGTNGIVFVFDGVSWSESYDSAETDISCLAVYNNKLYAGTRGNGIIYVFDGVSWAESYDSAETKIRSLAVYDNKLYAGSGVNGVIYVFDGASWSESYDSAEKSVRSLAAYNNKLYAGTDENGMIYVFDGIIWSESYNSTEVGIRSLAVYNNKLYAGSSSNGMVYKFDGYITNVSPKIFDRLNGTTVDSSGVITDDGGTAIPAVDIKGILIESQGTNLLQYSEQFDHTVWSKNNITVTANSIDSPDGFSSADTLTAVASNSTILQTITSASGNRVFSIWLKRKTGTGNIDLTVDGGTGWTTKTITTSWVRYEIFQASVIDPSSGIRIVTSGDEIYVWAGQLESADFSTSYIKTESASVVRGGDILTYGFGAGNFLQSFFLEIDVTLLTDGSNYATNEFRLFGTDDSGGTNNEVSTVGHASTYDYIQATGGGVFQLSLADFSVDTLTTITFLFRREGGNVRAIVNKDGVEKLNKTVIAAGAFAHSDTGNFQVGGWGSEICSGYFKNIKISALPL